MQTDEEAEAVARRLISDFARCHSYRWVVSCIVRAQSCEQTNVNVEMHDAARFLRAQLRARDLTRGGE
jgi:hypothetical protein